MKKVKMKETDLSGYKQSIMFPEYKVNLEKGRIINKKNEILGSVNPVTGYVHITIDGKFYYYLHRLIYHEANPFDLIEEWEQIDHIDNNKQNNKISNLQKLTRSENLKKAAKNRDYSFVKNNHKNKHYVKATNISTKEVDIYGSLNQVKKHLGINACVVKHHCEKSKNTVTSPETKQVYKVEYITKEEYEKLKQEGIRYHEKIKMTLEEIRAKQAKYKKKKKQKQQKADEQEEPLVEDNLDPNEIQNDDEEI
jgi:hypothetical protein